MQQVELPTLPRSDPSLLGVARRGGDREESRDRAGLM